MISYGLAYHPKSLVFQNEAIFVLREAYPPMKISCKFGEPSWCSFPLRALMLKISTRGDGGVANAQPKYPPDASGGYKYVNSDN